MLVLSSDSLVESSLAAFFFLQASHSLMDSSMLSFGA